MDDRTRAGVQVWRFAGTLLTVSTLVGVGLGGTLALAQLDLSVFRKKGASEEQQSTDRDECHKAAVQILGFDPTIRPPNHTPPWMDSEDKAQFKARQAVEQRKKQQEYNEIMKKCMERRGYSLVQH